MAMNTFNDELEDVTTPTPTVKTPTQNTQATATAAAPAPAQTKTTPKQTAAVADDDDIPTGNSKSAADEEDDDENLSTDFDDAKVYIRTGQLNQCRPGEKGKAVRFAFVPKEWIAPQTAKTHYPTLPDREGKPRPQRIRCLTPLGADVDPKVCCIELDEDGAVEVVALVVHYTNANPETGNYDKDAAGNRADVQFAIEFIRLSQFNMKQIKKLPDEDGSPFDIDIVMTHAEGRAFGYEFHRKATSPRWKSDPKTVEAVTKAAKKFLDGKILRQKLGAKKNEVEWKALLANRKVGGDLKLNDVEGL
jgi:hypothetical protein